MKIGILTFHCAHNYGAVLQVYAVQEQLKNMGYEVEIIDYRPDYLLHPYRYKLEIKNICKSFRLEILKWLKMKMVSFYHQHYTFQRQTGFNQFIKERLNLSVEIFFKPFESNFNYDCFVIGSDQVWNPNITKKFDTLFWGNFQIKENAKKITYAASMPLYTLSDVEKKQLQNNLLNFSAISVRETQLRDFLMKNFSVSVQTVLDPTLLVTDTVWRKIAIAPKINRKYVLIYTLGGVGKYAIDLAKQIATRIGGVVVQISGAELIKKKDVYSVTPTPEEFVGWFQNAAFVVTSSFHGTTFSISFQKPFFSIAKGSDKDSRLYSLLNDLGLENRLIFNGCMPMYSEIDYSEVLLKLDLLRRKSLGFFEVNL